MKLGSKDLTKGAGNLLNASNAVSSLSAAEMKIACMTMSGLSVAEIAQHECLAILEVTKHKKNIRKKLGIENTQISLECYLISKWDNQAD